MCLILTYLGCHTAMQVWNKDSWHRWPVKIAWYKLGLTLIKILMYGCSNWPVVWPSEIMYACWWWTFWTTALKWMFIILYILNAVRCPYVRNAGRGQLSSEWRHNENDVIMITAGLVADGTGRKYGDMWLRVTSYNALVCDSSENVMKLST